MKTVKNPASVAAFLRSLDNARRRDDCKAVVRLMESITGEKPAMWGSSIIGFGSYHYRYESGREGDMFVTGVAPRKQNLVVYVMPGFSAYRGLLQRLGKHKTGKSCLYINKLDDIDLDVLEELIRHSADSIAKKYSG